ncbi:MAG: hypothetical protein WB473_04495, partial [Pedococcus sp.]
SLPDAATVTAPTRRDPPTNPHHSCPRRQDHPKGMAMKHTSITAKAPLTFAGTVLLGVALAAPAAARPDPGSGDVGTPASELPYSQEAYENHYLSPLPEPVPSVTGSASYRFVDENGVQVLQLGAGIVAGVALAGAGMAVASRRSHGHRAHPA